MMATRSTTMTKATSMATPLSLLNGQSTFPSLSLSHFFIGRGQKGDIHKTGIGKARAESQIFDLDQVRTGLKRREKPHDLLERDVVHLNFNRRLPILVYLGGRLRPHVGDVGP